MNEHIDRAARAWLEDDGDYERARGILEQLVGLAVDEGWLSTGLTTEDMKEVIWDLMDKTATQIREDARTEFKAWLTGESEARLKTERDRFERLGIPFKIDHPGEEQ